MLATVPLVERYSHCSENLRLNHPLLQGQFERNPVQLNAGTPIPEKLYTVDERLAYLDQIPVRRTFDFNHQLIQQQN